jgi:hypothetical protein
LHQFLYPFIVEWCRLRCKASGNGLFDLRHNFVKKWPLNLRKMQGKWRNGESSVLPNLVFNCTHQIFIHHRQSAAPRIIMHIFASFIKQSHPSPYHWTTHGTIVTAALRRQYSQMELIFWITLLFMSA